MATYFAVSFFVNGIVLPYFPVFLRDRGLSGEEIALVVGLPFMLRVFSMPVITAFADRMPDRRVLMLVLMLLITSAVVALGPLTDPTAIVAVSLVILILSYSHGPLTDTIAMSLERRGQGDYGKMRLWGSVSFIGGNLIGGAALDHFGVPAIYTLMMIGFSAAAFATFLLPRPGPMPTVQDAASLTILRKPAFLAVLLAGGFVQSSHAALYGFATITWQLRGYDEFLIGCFWAVGVVAEIILFAYASRLPQAIKPTTLIFIGGLIGVVRWGLFTVDAGAIPTLLIQIGHAGSFAIGHIGIMRFIKETVPEQRAASAQGTYVILLGFAMAAATAVSGRLWERIGDDAFGAMSVFAAIGVVILAITRSGASRLPTLAGSEARAA